MSQIYLETLGRKIVSYVIRTGELQPFLAEGWDLEWMTSTKSLAHVVVFKENDSACYQWILRHVQKHGRVPDESLFRMAFPEAVYQLMKVRWIPDELIDIGRKDLQDYEIQTAQVDVDDMLAEGVSAEEIAERFTEAAARIRTRRAAAGIVRDFNSSIEDAALERRMTERTPFGIHLGIDGFDSQEEFNGIQPSQLWVYLGRAKAGKSTFSANTALSALTRDGKTVLFVTFEMSDQQIMDKIYSLGAHVDATAFRTGKLTDRDKQKVRDFRSEAGDIEADLRIVQPTGKYGIGNLEEEIVRFEPDLVVIDGFYFMHDRDTGRSGMHWEAHDNLAGQIKSLGMDTGTAMLVTHQVREKQIAGKKGQGLDDSAMASGTGLIMACDSLITIDVDLDSRENKLINTRGRDGYLRSVVGAWNWKTSVFEEHDFEGDDEVIED